MSSHAFVLLCILWLSLELNKWIINGILCFNASHLFFPFCSMKCSLLGSFTLVLSFVEKISSSWSLLHCSQFTWHVKQHQCLIRWRQNSCNVSGPLWLPHFSSHLSGRLELHVPLYEHWEVDLVGDQGCRYYEHEKEQCDLHDAIDMFLVRQAVGAISGVETQSNNPWILYR